MEENTGDKFIIWERKGHLQQGTKNTTLKKIYTCDYIEIKVLIDMIMHEICTQRNVNIKKKILTYITDIELVSLI